MCFCGSGNIPNSCQWPKLYNEYKLIVTISHGVLQLNLKTKSDNLFFVPRRLDPLLSVWCMSQQLVTQESRALSIGIKIWLVKIRTSCLKYINKSAINQHPFLFTVSGVEIQHCLQPRVVLGFHRSPQHVGPPEEVPLQHGGAQDGAHTPSCHVHCTRRTIAASCPASRLHLTKWGWPPAESLSYYVDGAISTFFSFE